MRRYYKSVADGYILGVGIGCAGIEVCKEEYDEILSVIRNKPERTNTIDYKLKEDLNWEPYSIEPPEEDELDADEALAIIVGGDAE